MEGQASLSLAAPVCSVLAYSEAVAEVIAGEVQRGEVHSVFSAAANLLFQNDFVLSLNACDGVAVPNGLRLSAARGAFPFSALRPGMPVLLGAWHLHIEGLPWSVDLRHCPRWRARLRCPLQLEGGTLVRNRERLRRLLLAPELVRVYEQQGHPLLALMQAELEGKHQLPTRPEALAERLAGWGPGLTPAGDDLLLGWLAAGWWLHGSEPDFLVTCQRLVTVAAARTHLLSRTWLTWAGRGYFSLPLLRLLESLAEDDEGRLLAQAQAVLALGASSGYDLLCGLVLGLTSPSLQP